MEEIAGFCQFSGDGWFWFSVYFFFAFGFCVLIHGNLFHAVDHNFLLLLGSSVRVDVWPSCGTVWMTLVFLCWSNTRRRFGGSQKFLGWMEKVCSFDCHHQWTKLPHKYSFLFNFGVEWGRIRAIWRLGAVDSGFFSSNSSPG